MTTKWGILLILPFLVSPLIAQDVSDGTRVSLSRSPANEVPASEPLVLTCRTTTRGAQMRVEVQRPTDALPVTKTLSSLQSSGDYHVNITDEFLVSVTIKDVSQHNGTSYTCVQDIGSIRYSSDTFRLVLALSLSRSPVNEVPASGPLVLTCRTTTRGAQMHVEVQRPTDALAVTKTLSSLQSSGDYNVSITDELLVSVTIKDVIQHNDTSYTCVQYIGSIRYSSDTFRLVLASPVTVTSLVKEAKHGVKISVHWQIDAPMELQSCNVLLNCNDTWKDSHILDGTDRETHFRMRQTDFGNCSVTVKGVRNGVNVAMGTTSVQSEPKAIICFGVGFSGWVMLIIATLLCLGLTTLLIATVICVCRRRREQKSVSFMARKGNNYSQLVDAYQVKDSEMVSPPSVYQQSEKSISLGLA